MLNNRIKHEEKQHSRRGLFMADPLRSYFAFIAVLNPSYEQLSKTNHPLS